MIHEFAVEPELVAQWGTLSDYRYFATCFGLGRVRMVSEFPKLKNWRRDILKAIDDVGDLEKTRVLELVKIMSEHMVRRDGYAYDGTRPWLENSEAEHARCPFHLILASTNPRNNGRVQSKTIIGEPGDRLWSPRRSCPVPRTPGDLTRELAPMLRNCSEAHFIDPHFGPEDYDYRITLEAILIATLANRGGPPPSLVSRHINYKT